VRQEFLYHSEPTPGTFKFSPSQFSKFIKSPHTFYREQILGEAGFEGSTASYLGTIIHAIAESVAKNDSITRGDVKEFIQSIDDTEIDLEEIENQYPLMAKTLVNDYILKQQDYISVEQYLKYKLASGYELAGSIDAIQGNRYYLNSKGLQVSKLEYGQLLEAGKACSIEYANLMITDYKTYNSKTKPKSIPDYYRYQLLCYAYLASKLYRTSVKYIRLVYINRYIDGGISEKTGKPLKSYPPEVTVVTEEIDQESLDFIESQLKLAIGTSEATKQHPELAKYLWHDPRLEHYKGQLDNEK